MNILFCLSTFPFNILFLISNTYQLIEYYTKGETKFTTTQRYFVPYDQNLLDSKQRQFPIELIHEVKIENQDFINVTDQMKLFYFKQLISEEDNMIMVMDNQSLYCLYIIKDYLLNQQLVITPHFCNITLPYQSCNKLIQVKQQIFIINCQLNDNQTIISIINLDGKVYDQIILEIDYQCKIDFQYKFQYLFIFEQNCKSNNIYQVEIDELLYQYKSIKILELMQLNNITYSQFGYLLNINICVLERIYIIYQKLILNYNLIHNKFTYYIEVSDATILNVVLICQTNLILDIENNSKQLRINKNLLNISNSKYINSLIIEKILVIQFNDYILARINDELQQYINLSISEIIPLNGSPYFVCVYQSKLKIFEIQPPKTNHQFFQSQRILYLIFTSISYLQQFDLEQSDIEILQQNETRLIINQQERMTYLNNDNEDICFQQSIISKSLPINLQTIKENDIYYQINETLYIDTCNLNYQKYIKFIYFGKFNDQINIFIMLKQEDIISFVFCKNDEIIQEKNIKLISQIIDIMIFEQGKTLIHYEKCIQLIKIDDTLSIIIKNIPQEKKIIRIENQVKLIGILYENCKLAFILTDFEHFYLQEESQSYLINCTHYYSISKNQILINQNEIIYISTMKMKYKIQGNIIEVFTDVVSNIFVLVVEEQNEITLRCYRLLKNEFILWYIIPTYNFKYQPSDSEKFDTTYLMISAKYQNKLYLLVYNLKNSAINSLIYITQIDESQQFYQLFDDFQKIVVYMYNGKLYFQNLNQICFRYSIQQQNIFIMKKKLEFIVNSFVGNLSTSISIQIQKINNNYTLDILNNTQKNNFYSLNWDLIQGNIIKVDIKSNQNYIIKLPLNITQQYFTCQYFESNVCLNHMSLIDIKTFNIIDNFTTEFIKIKIKGIIFNQESLIYYIFYKIDNLFLLMIQLDQNNTNNLDQFVIIQKETVKSVLPEYHVSSVQKVKIIQDIQYYQLVKYEILLFYKNICRITDLFQMKENQYYFIDLAYLSNHTYIIIHWQSNNFKIQFIYINNVQMISEFYCKVDIIQQYDINLQDILENVEFNNFDIFVFKAQIFQLQKKGHIYIFKFIMIYQTSFSIIFEFSFDSIKYDNFKIESYRYLRYEKNAQFLELLYADDNFIVATFKQDNNQFVNVYNIKGELNNNKDYLDSIQRIESQDYKRIEKLNTSHYVIFSDMNKSLYLMTLDQFKVECLSECTQNAQLILSNDVSTLSLDIQLVNQSLLLNIITIKFRIQLGNLLFILIYLKYSKRGNRFQLQNKLKVIHQ